MGKRKPALQQCPADDFIHRVVTSDILEIVAGGSHGYGERLVTKLDEQRFFPHEGIG